MWAVCFSRMRDPWYLCAHRVFAGYREVLLTWVVVIAFAALTRVGVDGTGAAEEG